MEFAYYIRIMRQFPAPRPAPDLLDLNSAILL